MYIDKLVNLKNYIKDEKLLSAITDFIANGNTIASGKHSLIGDSFANVIDYESKAFETVKMEAHRKYLDVQVIISGEETVLKQDIGTNPAISEYNEDKDVAFYAPKTFDKALLTEGTFGIMFPEDLHQCVAVTSPITVRKIVFKIPVGLI